MNEEHLPEYAEEYQTVKELLKDLEEDEVRLYVHVEGKGYTDIGMIFPEGRHLDKICTDLKVYLIELREKIRRIMREDELETTGTVTEETEDDDPDFEVPERRQGIPKQDYRRDHE